MFTCFSVVQRRANAKTAFNKHKFVVARVYEGRSAVGEALLSLRPAHFLQERCGARESAFVSSARKQTSDSTTLPVFRYNFNRSPCLTL